jgi:hypothetical protein
MTPEPTDLASIDRDVGRAHAAWRAWVRDLATDPDQAADVEPLDRWRHVAGKTFYETLRAAKPSAADVPLRDALARWVFALLLARIGHPVDVELARAIAEKSGHMRLPRPHLASWHEAWRGLVGAETTAERSSWLDVAVERGPILASVTRRLAQRRDEAAHRLGLAHQDALFPVPREALVAAASTLLDRTDELARDQLRAARKRAELEDDPPGVTDAIAIAVARDAPEGWPACLSPAWLETTFAPFIRGLRLEAPRVEAALGGSSFARACSAFGASFRAAAASPSLPFALARDPAFVPMHRFASVFGALPASPAFQKRVLGNGARVSANQARVLARTALLHARLEAARYLASRAPPAIPFEDLTHRLFGAPLPRALAGAWPAAHEDSPARLVGLLTAPSLRTDLVDRFDEDWFANPRATTHLRAIGSGPAYEDAPPTLDGPVTATVRAFEEALA